MAVLQAQGRRLMDAARVLPPHTGPAGIATRLADSDVLVERFRARGTTSREALAEMLARVEVTDADLMAVHRANPAIFGGRPMQECRESLDTLVRIHRVREILDDKGAMGGVNYAGL